MLVLAPAWLSATKWPLPGPHIDPTGQIGTMGMGWGFQCQSLPMQGNGLFLVLASTGLLKSYW